MKVKVLCNLGTRDFGSQALPEGEHEVNDAFGAKLIKRRLAVEIVPPPKPEPKAAVVSEPASKPASDKPMATSAPTTKSK